MTGQKLSQETFKFDVFISYRHADLDNAVAGYLQKALEHYHVPREIRKKCGKENIQRVFRDEEELGVASDLFSEIEQNLKQSEFLVVICSPRILESKWCLREIETFIKYRGRDNILPVLIEGEPETAFPPILLEHGEPLAADLRGRDKREVLRHARERMPRLAAPLLYCSYDELYQRHRVYKMRRMLAAAGMVTAVSLAFGGVTMMQSREIQRQSGEIQQRNQEIQQRNEEIQQRNEEIQQQNEEIRRSYQAKLENQFRYLAKTAAELQDSGDRDAALLVALEALPRSSADTSRPYVAEARIALEQALYTYDLSYRYQLYPYKQLEHREEIGSVTDRNTEENVLLTTDAGCIYIWNGAHCENICIQAYSGKLVDARLTGDHRVAVMTGTGAWCFDYQTGQVLWQWDYPVCDSGSCSAPDLLWTYDSVSGQLLCANWSFRLHKSDTSGDAEPAAGHMLYLLDAATGESRLWAPAELVDLLEGDPYRSVYLDRRGFALSPGGAWTVLTVDPSFSSSGIVLGVFPTGGDEAVFSRTLTKLSSLISVMRGAVFPDGDHLAFLYLTEDGTMLGQTAHPSQWQLECWDLRTGEQHLSHQDTCLALDLNVDIKLLTPADGAVEDMVLSVTFDNVAVNLDWSTGERLTRIEDRSAIALNHYFSTTSELVVTADGYLFVTNPTSDMTWAPMFDAYHYYIGLSRIERSEWLDGCAYFFTATGVYCYTPPVDDSYASLAARPYDVSFTADSSRLLVGCNNNRIYFFDTDDFSVLWEDEYYSGYSNQTSALLDDRLAAWLTGDGTALKLRSLSDGSVREVQLDGFTADLAGNIYWNLRPVGGGKVLVWNGGYNGFYQSDTAKLDDTALWLADGDRGEVTARWSYRDILGNINAPYYLSGLVLYVEWPAATADGRYVLIPCHLRGNVQNSFGEKEPSETVHVLIWDLEKWETVELSERVTQGMERSMILGTYFEQDGWISPTEAAAVFYNSERKLLQVVDVTTGNVLHELEVDGIASREVSFTPDGDHLIFQDPQRRICVYNWKTGEYTMHNATSEVGYMSFSFHQDGQVLCAPYKGGGMSSETSLIYRRTGDGIYKQETAVGPCENCDGRTVVINDDSYPRLYHAYTLDDLIAMAKKILNGRELTGLERMSYLID